MQVITNSGHPIISQIFSYIPDDILKTLIDKFNSDKSYKTLKTKVQLGTMLYGVISKSTSLNGLLKNLAFFGAKLSSIGMGSIPARSTLADANRNRKSEVFEHLYYSLVKYYKEQLSCSYLQGFYKDEVKVEKIKIFDSTTFSLFVDVFKGAGRNPINGKKKGGLKAHTLVGLDSMVPEMVWLSAASKNDKDFLGQLKPKTGEVYIFDKGYVNYDVYEDFTQLGSFYVTRLNENAVYKTLEVKNIDYNESQLNGIIEDKIIELNAPKGPIKARLVTYKTLLTGKVYTYITNLFDVQATTVSKLYKNRWEIEPFFKQLKQNFELRSFYSDSQEGIKTQIWIALIANLIFTIIHRQSQQAEAFTTIVQIARSNMASYINFLDVVKLKKWPWEKRNIEIIQLTLFPNLEGGVFENSKNTS